MQHRSTTPELDQPPADVSPAAEVLHDEGALTAGTGAAVVPLHADHAPPVETDLSQSPDAAVVPSFTRALPAPPRRRVPGWQWSVLALLVAMLGVQMLIADRARLAQDAYWRPLLERMCQPLRCTLPAWHQPQAYTMLARDVRPVLGVPGVLQVHATFRNDAAWPQAWPAIAVALSDADGRIAGARVLMPKDYLDAPLRQTTVAPGQSGEMTVQVREPPEGVVAFAFEFR